MVTWESSGQDGSGHGVYGQRYDSLGNTVGDEFRINTFTDNNQKSPSVTSLSDGGFVVTWESSGQDGSGHGIYGQRYDSLGNTVGDEFRINTFTDNNQKSPSVTSLSDGGFVVTWESFGQDGFGLGIFGKYHDTNLNTLGNYNENSAPTLTGFDGTVQMTEEDAEVEISFADLIRAGDEADVNGTVNGFVIKSVESGTLRIGTDAASASAYDAAANNRIDAAQHAYWTPDADANGELGAFSVVAVDDSGAESAIPVEARVRVTAVNDAPEGIVTISGALEQGETLTADASGISDPDGLGVFSYQWYADGEAIEGATLESYELTGLEVGKQMTVRMSYTDGQGTEEAVTSASTGEVSNTNNTPPVIEQPIPDGAAYTEEIYTYDVSAHFRDDDAGDTLHYSATNVDGSVLPAWLTIDPVSGILSGIAQSGDIGINGVLVRATDASGSTVEDMFRLLVTNRNYGETEGNDRLFGGSGDDAIFGSGGDDRIFGRAGEDILVGGTGDDFLRGDDGNDELYGGNGTDRLYGGSGNDLLYGDEGNDTLFGQNGRDTLYGGNGDDTMRGGGGDDLFYGGEGDDTLFGQGGRDTLYGGNGDDSIRGDNGNDELYGGNGADSLSGGGGNDLLYGGEGNDVLSGQGGGDTLYGGNGDDSLRGGSGNDLLYGGEGNDALFGQGGRDTLYGGNGTDRLSGGGGNDTLLYTDILESGTGPNERDVITDFTPGRDKIDLSAIDANSDLSGDQAFSTTLIDGGDPFSDAGQLRFDIDSGILYGNVDSDLAADFAIQVEISGVGALSFLDIIF